VRIRSVRVARQTDRLEECERFYADLLGLPVLARFAAHAGYEGVVLGLPGVAAELELTRHAAGSAASPGAPDDLVVLALDRKEAVDALAERLAAAGIEPVAPVNPWWADRALVVPDPDGRLVVLAWDVFDDEGLFR